MKQQYLQILLVGFLSGVFVNNVVGEEMLSLLIFGFFLTFIVGFSLYIRQYRHKVLPLMIGISLGVLCSFWTLRDVEHNQQFLSSYQFSPQDITLTILDIQKRNSDMVEYRGEVFSLGDSGEDISAKNIQTLVKIPVNFVLVPGDRIAYRSRILFIEDFDRFRYENYMLSKDIYFRSYGYTFEKVSSGNIPSFLTSFFYVRRFLLDKLSELYPGEEKIFLGGILLGAREDIPQDLKTDFNNSGLTHFIAVSGFNITILVLFFGYIFRFFPIYIRTFLVITSIILFTILVGLSAPVVRAAIMGILAYVILISGRQSNSMVLILITASLMVLFSPLSLNYDVSFHLSFLAVIGIVYTQGFFKNMFSFLPETLAIREAFVLTLSALSFTVPIMMFQFGQISLLAPLANIAVTWTIPIAMLLGFLSLIAYLLYAPIGYMIAFVDWVFLKFDIMMVHFFGGLDFALIQIDFGVYSIYIEIVYFLILIFLVAFFTSGNKQTA